MLFLTLHLSVQKAHIAFATTPEYIVCASKLYCCINSVLYLHSGTCNNIKVRISCSTIHVSLITKNVCSTPQQFDICALHLFKSIISDCLHTSFIFLDSLTLVNQVNIMEAEIFYAKFVHYFKSGIHLVLSALNCISFFIPCICTCSATKLVTACCA